MIKFLRTGVALALLTVLGLTAPLTAIAGGAPAEDASLLDTGFKYIELDPIMLPIIDSNGVSQVINLVVALEVKDRALVNKAEKLQPKLKDAFIQDMYGSLARQSRKSGGMLQLASIKKRLLKVSNEILADDKRSVNDVLLQMLHQRRI